MRPRPATHPRAVGPSHRRGAAAAVLAAAVLAAAWYLLTTAPVSAEQSFLSGFAAAYPAAAGTPLDSCLLCHTNPAAPSEDNLNRYGDDWDEIGDERFLTPALVNRDSDGDGVPNGREIEQLSFPGDPASSTPPVTTTTVPGTPPDGAALFAARCAACHGPGGGDLSGTALGRSRFVSITLNGRGSMPAQSGLTDAEAGAIWDYVTGNAPPATTTTTTAGSAGSTPTSAPSGAAVYAESCSVCHGAGGGNLVPTSLSRSRIIGIITSGTGSMRGFPELGDAAIAAVADYLLGAGANPPATTTTIPGATTTTAAARSGSAVFAAECAACHGTAGGNLRGRTLDLPRITAVTRDGTAGMPGYAGRLGSTEISRVAAYVLSVGAPAGTTTTTTAAAAGAAPPLGSTLYQQNCSACHGLHGEGGSGGPVAGTTMGRDGVMAIVSNGTAGMPGYGSTLSAAEIGAVADHVLAIGSGTDPTTTVPAGAGAEPPQAADAADGPSGVAPLADGETADPAQDTAPRALEPVQPGDGGPGPNPVGFALLAGGALAAVVVGFRSLRNLTTWRED